MVGEGGKQGLLANQTEQKIIALRESQEQQELAVIEAEQATLRINDQSIQIPSEVYAVYGLPLVVEKSAFFGRTSLDTITIPAF